MEKQNQEYILRIEDLRKHFPISKRGVISSKKIGDIKALDGVNLVIKKGEIIGIVGESGSGKTGNVKCQPVMPLSRWQRLRHAACKSWICRGAIRPIDACCHLEIAP